MLLEFPAGLLAAAKPAATLHMLSLPQRFPVDYPVVCLDSKCSISCSGLRTVLGDPPRDCTGSVADGDVYQACSVPDDDMWNAAAWAILHHLVAI